jgi:hypothetical protein
MMRPLTPGAAEKCSRDHAQSTCVLAGGRDEQRFSARCFASLFFRFVRLERDPAFGPGADFV